MINGNVRSMMRFLQVYPIVTALAFLLDTILDAVGIVITDFIGAVFGVSIFPLVYLWWLSRRLKVSVWSRIMYATLFVVILFYIINGLFAFTESAIIIDKIVFIILTSGTISSLLTYIYTKYRAHGNI